jgi:hypothetical protein
MRLRRLAVLVLTLASVTLPAAPLTGAPASSPSLAAGITGPVDPTEPIDLTPPKMGPGPGGPATCCTFG